MKRVLFVFHNANYYSGATRSMTDIVVKIHNRIDATVLVPENEGSAKDVLEANGVKVVSMPYKVLMQDERSPVWKRALKTPIYYIRYLQQKRMAKTGAALFSDIDIVYSNTSTVFLGAMIAKELSVPHIWHFREFRHEDHRIHCFLGERWHMNYVASHADKIIMISKSMVKKHSTYFSADKIELIYNELPKSYIISKQKYNENKHLQLLIAGDVKPGKGQLDVVKAVGQLKQQGTTVILNVAGKCTDVDYKEKIEKCIEDYKIKDNVIFHGMIKDMNALRSKMDVGIVASSLEAFGRVTIEGMLAHLCMVGCNSGGTKELIQNEETGLLYEPNDVHNLTAILQSLNDDRDRLMGIAENGFKYAEQTFTEGACSNRVLQIITDLTCQ